MRGGAHRVPDCQRPSCDALHADRQPRGQAAAYDGALCNAQQRQRGELQELLPLRDVGGHSLSDLMWLSWQICLSAMQADDHSMTVAKSVDRGTIVRHVHGVSVLVSLPLAATELYCGVTNLICVDGFAVEAELEGLVAKVLHLR